MKDPSEALKCSAHLSVPGPVRRRTNQNEGFSLGVQRSPIDRPSGGEGADGQRGRPWCSRNRERNSWADCGAVATGGEMAAGAEWRQGREWGRRREREGFGEGDHASEGTESKVLVEAWGGVAGAGGEREAVGVKRE